MKRMRRVNCPTCGAEVEWRPESTFRPFCSERCKMRDLGAWATERYRVPTEDASDDPNDPNDPDERAGAARSQRSTND